MTVAPNFRELIAVRVMREQEWAYEQRSRHLSYREMRRRSILPTYQGGLGYDVSEHTLKGLVTGYTERMRETLQESPEFYMHRELADLEEQYRVAAALADPIDRSATMLAAYALGFTSVEQLLAESPESAVPQDGRVILAALATMRQTGERRAKLLGLDAATTHKVDVTVTDAVDAEVARLAAELDSAATS
jgi:hypothetical protein